MAELTERQLLLLNNLMYYAGSDEKATLSEIAAKAQAKASNYPDDGSFSGGFESQAAQMAEIAREIENDPVLKYMRVDKSIHTEGVHAVCVVDSEGNATVAIRGTGGTYEAWSDNLEGAYGTGTEVQQEFGRFMETVAAEYDNITITGHSKGGNLAQYATVTMGDEIDRCVSFDGQGFSSEFCEKYAAEIQANQDKIKSINSKDDYVNILLESIAGETVYLEYAEGTDAHSPYGLWKGNEHENGGGIMNSDGEYCNTVEQSSFIRGLDDLAQVLTECVNNLPDAAEHSVVDFLGSVVGMIFAVKTGRMKFEHLMDLVGKGLEALLMTWPLGSTLGKAWLLGMIAWEIGEYFAEHGTQVEENKNRKPAPVSGSAKPCTFVMKYNGLGKEADAMKSSGSVAAEIAEELGGVELTGSGLAGVNRALRRLESRIRGHAAALSLLGENLYEIRELYSTAEDRISAAYSEI